MRWRNFFSGIHLVVLVIAVCVLFVALYLIASHFYYRWDLTEGNLLSLSPQTIQVLGSLRDEEIGLYVFVPDQDLNRSRLRMLLDQYRYYHKKLHYELVDPDRHPAIARRYEVRAYGTVVVQIGENENRALRPTEEAITEALYRFTNKEPKPLYCTYGHDEPAFNDDSRVGYRLFADALSKENYVVRQLLLMRSRVPDDCSVLVIAGPKWDFQEEEVEAIRSYVNAGGRLLVLFDPLREEPLERLERMLGYYGILLHNDIIVDEASRLFGSDYLVPVITQYGRHEITKDFTLPCFLPLTRSVSLVESNAVSAQGTPLAFTSQESWAESDLILLDQGGQAKYEPETDGAGPVSVGVALVGKASEGAQPFRLIVMGDSDFANNRYLLLSGNRDLAMNSVNWLTEEESLISIRPRTLPSSPIIMTELKQRMVFLTSVIGLPILPVFVGITVLVIRKRRA